MSRKSEVLNQHENELVYLQRDLEQCELNATKQKAQLSIAHANVEIEKATLSQERKNIRDIKKRIKETQEVIESLT